MMSAVIVLAFGVASVTAYAPNLHSRGRAVASRAPMCRMQESDLRGFLLQKVCAARMHVPAFYSQSLLMRATCRAAGGCERRHL